MRDIKKAIPIVLVAAIAVMWMASPALAHPDYGCKSCHVPHNAYVTENDVPLWNPDHTTTTLTEYYDSPTLEGDTTGGPDGASKLCLSCHDGSYSHVADGSQILDENGDPVLDANGDPTYNEDHRFGAGKGMGSLDATHPISFTYDATLVANDTAANGGVPGLVDPSTLADDILPNGKVQCTSCHDVHNTAADYGMDPFRNLRWLYDNDFSGGPPAFNNAAFCRNCHLK